MKRKLLALILATVTVTTAANFSACDFGGSNGDNPNDGNTTTTPPEDITEPRHTHEFENEVCKICGYHTPTEGLEYRFEGKGMYYGMYCSFLSGTSKLKDESVIYIADEYDNEPVCGVGINFALDGFSNLTRVVIPDSVKYIMGGVFWECSSLTCMEIPDSVIYISALAFEGCDGIIQTESGVQYVDNWAIKCDTSLTEVSLRENTRGIAGGAFEGCNKLTSIVIPDSVKSICDGAFSGCSGLTDITIGKGVTHIGNLAFKNCSELTSIVIPDSVTSIGNFLNYPLSDVDAIEISDYGYGAFYNCSKLETVTFGNGIKSVGDDIFFGCEKLKYNEYDNAKYIGTADNPYAVLIKAKDNKISSCTIHEDTKVIGASAFLYCNRLENIIIPDNVTYICNNAFNGCDIKTVTIGNSVKSINDYAFSNCRELENIIIPNNVTNIGWGAFSYCDSLTSITIPKSVNNVGWLAFNACRNLTIYCEVNEKPEGWRNNWNGGVYSLPCPVVWGYKG